MNFNTLYNRQFNKVYKNISLAKTKQELVEDALKLRASNIVLGTDNPFKMSEFQKKFNKKKLKTAYIDNSQKKNNI
jgi:hypothetical protein